MATTFKAYLIHCITNLHAGSGDSNYGIIDKMVQRDPVTSYPTIHASSLKGGLREHFENNPTLKSQVDAIFGKEGKNGMDSESGSHRFLNADLLALPVRCTHKQFVYGIDHKLVEFINAKSNTILKKAIFKIDVSESEDFLFGSSTSEVYAEDYKLKVQTYQEPFNFKQELITNQFATLQTSNFETIVKNLPVIARNRVGENKNLWYEEIVPHQTLFITFIGTSDTNTDFNKALTTELIQIGANASVGYGLCRFYEIKFLETKTNAE